MRYAFTLAAVGVASVLVAFHGARAEDVGESTPSAVDDRVVGYSPTMLATVRHDFLDRLHGLGETPMSGVQSLTLLRSAIQPLSDDTLRGLYITTWLDYLGKHADNWCVSPDIDHNPFFATIVEGLPYSLEIPLVEADSSEMWLGEYCQDFGAFFGEFADFARDSAGRAKCHGLAYTDTSLREFHFRAPNVPSMAEQETMRATLLRSVSAEWARWNSAWDAFEKATGGNTWVPAIPVFGSEFQMAGQTRVFRINPNGGFALSVVRGNEISLSWRGIQLAREKVHGVNFCQLPPQYGDYPTDKECDTELYRVDYAHGALLLRGDPIRSHSWHKIVRISDPEAPTPFLYCRKSARPYVRLPRWITRTSAVASYVGPFEVGFFADGLPSTTEKSTPPPSELKAFEELLMAEEPPPPHEADQNRYGMALVKRALKNDFYPRLAEKLRAVDALGLPGRFRQLGLWIRYFEAAKAHGEFLESQRKQELERQKEIAKRERARKATEAKVLASVPGAGARCRSATKAWHAAKAAIERAAVAGNPRAVTAAKTSQEKAFETVCESAASLREAIRIYKQKGLSSAAEAIQREHWQCVSSCQ